MACTIDHLAPELAVRVLQSFTDLRGVAVPAGARGVIAQLGLDWGNGNCFMEWERAGCRETLWFSGRKTEGMPSNGTMRAFFEVDAAPLEPRPAASASASAAALACAHALAPAHQGAVEKEPSRTETSSAPSRRRQPADDTSLHERRVACDCHPGLHRPVMTFFGEWSVHACMRCGTVTCSQSIGDDGRFTGDAWQVNRSIALTDGVLAWLAQWPRATSSARSLWPMAGALVPMHHHYLPADAHCGTLEELAALEARLAVEHANLNNARRLRRSGFPTAAPPANLPQGLASFASIWRALQLRADSPVDDLISHAQVDNPGSAVAADLLRQRPDGVALMLDCLRSNDRVRRSAGHAIALLHTPADPALAAAVLAILESLPLTPLLDAPGRIASWQRFEALLILVTELKLGTAAMLAALPKLQRKLARHDADLVKCIDITLRELRGLPPLPWGPHLP